MDTAMTSAARDPSPYRVRMGKSEMGADAEVRRGLDFRGR